MLFHYRVGQYFFYSEFTDMRKGIDSLCGMVRNQLNKNPLLGDLFIFVNRRKNQEKMLHWQTDGFAVFYKRLEKGTYEIPSVKNSLSEISSEQLLFILQGVILKSVKKKKRYSLSCVENN